MARRAQGLTTPVRLSTALVIALAGTLVHDLVEFGMPSLQNSVPAGLIFAVLYLVWWRQERLRSLIEVVLVVFIAVMLFGGAIASIAPLPIWPFVPPQTLEHYAAHIGWLLALMASAWIVVQLHFERRQSSRVACEAGPKIQ